MKKIELGTPIYDKIFEVSEKVFEKLNLGDIKYLTLGEQIKELSEKGEEIGVGMGLFESIVRHYVAFDYIHGCIHTINDASKEVKILKTNVFGFFEVKEKKKDRLVYLDIHTGKEYEIIGEGMGSEKRLEELQVGDLVVSRLLKFDDGWYNLRIYFYFIMSEDGDTSIQKYALSGAKDIYEAFERVYLMNKTVQKTSLEGNINYERRIRKILGKNLTKKGDKELNKILKSISEKTLFEFEKFISNFKGLDERNREELYNLILGLINSKISTPYTGDDSYNNNHDSNDEYSKRFFLVSQRFFQDVEKKLGKTPGERISESDLKKIESFKNKWFATKNPLFSLLTPEEFLKGVREDFMVSDFRLNAVSEDELDFYDGYTTYFTSEEKKIYEKGLKMSKKKQFLRAYIEFEKLMGVHSEFFRLRANYLMIKYQYLIDRYGKNKCNTPTTVEELEKDREFIDEIYDEIKYVKKLKPGYIFPNNFEKILDENNDILMMAIGAYSFIVPKEDAKRLMQSGEKEVIKYLNSEIKYFSVEELIHRILHESSFFITRIYSKENRFYKKLTGWKETKLFDLFEFLWERYKKSGYFIFDDARKVYENILKIDNKGNHIWDLKKIDEFDEILDLVLTFLDTKKLLRDFDICLEVGNLIDPEYIYENIGDVGYKDTFRSAIGKFGYKIDGCK